MRLTDYFEELEGKVPYIDRFEDIFCSFEQKKEIKCKEEFFEQGFCKNSNWDLGAEYQYKCHACPYFHHDVGFYFGDFGFGHTVYSDDFDSKTSFFIKVKTSNELAQVVKHMPKAKSVFLVQGGNIDLSPIEELNTLESIQFDIGSKNILWDMSKTPNLRVLEICMGKSPASLDMLSKAHSVEYLNLQTFVSQITPTVLPSFDFLKGMANLKGVVLAAVTNASKSIDALMELPRIQRLWVSPNLFPTEEYAKFEAQKFKIYRQFGIFESDDFSCPFGIRKRQFQSEKSKEKFLSEYHALMNKYT